MLDEPANGLTHSEVDELGDTIRSIRTSSTSILLVEHHMAMVMAISTTSWSSTSAARSPRAAQRHPQRPVVIEAYLGAPA